MASVGVPLIRSRNNHLFQRLIQFDRAFLKLVDFAATDRLLKSPQAEARKLGHIPVKVDSKLEFFNLWDRSYHILLISRKTFYRPKQYPSLGLIFR